MIHLLALALAAASGASPGPPSEQLTDRVRILAAGLTAADPHQRARAEQQILALGPEGTEPLLVILKTADPAQAEAIDRLLPRFGPEAIPTLVVAPARTGPYTQVAREAALEAVARMGQSAFPDIRKLLDSDYEGRRGFGIGALRRMGPLAREELTALLRHPRQDVRSSAAYVLAGFRDPRSADALLDGLASGDASVQSSSAEGLAALGDRRAIEPLLGLLDSPSVGLRMSVVAALGKLYEPRIRSPLVHAMRHDSEVVVRNIAANALISQRGDPLAMRLSRRYRPPTISPDVEDPERLVHMLRLVMTGFLIYGALWAGARWSRGWLPWPIWLSAVSVAAVGFYWGFRAVAVTPTVERWLLQIAVPASAGLALAIGPKTKVLLIPLAGFGLSVCLTVVGAATGVLGWLFLSWLAPRFLVAVLLATSVVAIVQMFRPLGDRQTLWRFRVAALLGLAAFYAGYVIGWRALWGGQAPSLL